MKWFKKGKKPTSGSSDQSISYEYYDDQLIVDREMEIKRPDGPRGHGGNDPNPDPNQRHLWVYYQLGKTMGPLEQQDYEIFVGGFLTYHENIIKFNRVKYKIYFEWSLEGHKKPFSVAIYISPAPVKRDMPNASPGYAQANADSTGQDDKAEAETEIAFAAPPPVENSFQSIDPPKPPPPPPPPRD